MRSKALVCGMLFLVIALVNNGCGPAGGTAPVETPAPAESTAAPVAAPEVAVDRETLPEVSQGDLAELVAGNSTFALDLYHTLQEEASPAEGDNLFFSPYSISAALAMTYAGARTETEAQMAETLHFGLTQDRLHPAFNGLDLALAGRGQKESGQEPGTAFRLHIASSLWAQVGYPFRQAFFDLLAENYETGLLLVDFVADAEAARLAINAWVADRTEGRVEDLIPPGLIDDLTTLVLANTVHFSGAWATPFDPSLTEDGAFHRLDGGKVTVPMMQQRCSLGYAQGDKVQAVELPYAGYELSMVILMPEAGAFEAFGAALDAGRLAALVAGIEERRVTLTMPRFEIQSDFELGEMLASMGMPLAFTSGADFSGITSARDLFIGAVVHDAFVAVDEAGTEAAAAAAVIHKRGRSPGQPVEVRLDRPFLILIRDNETGTIVFLGRVLDPSNS